MVLPGRDWIGLYMSSVLPEARLTYAVSATLTLSLLYQAMAACTAALISGVCGCVIRKVITPTDSWPLFEGSSYERAPFGTYVTGSCCAHQTVFTPPWAICAFRM